MVSGILVVIAASCLALFIIANVIRDLVHYHRLDKYSKEREEDEQCLKK